MFYSSVSIIQGGKMGSSLFIWLFYFCWQRFHVNSIYVNVSIWAHFGSYMDRWMLDDRALKNTLEQHFYCLMLLHFTGSFLSKKHILPICFEDWVWCIIFWEVSSNICKGLWDDDLLLLSNALSHKVKLHFSQSG